MQIVVIDDHPIVLEGVKMILQTILSSADIQVAKNGQEGLDILHKTDVDLIFLDIALPDINGVELCKQIRPLYSGIKIIGFSANQEVAIVSEFVKNGGNGFLLKTADKAEYESCIQTVMRGELYLGADIKNKLLEQLIVPKEIRNFPSITRREKEILLLLMEGKTGPQIAKSLFLSPLTVETHRKNLMQKYQVNNLQSLISKLKQLGVI